MENALPPLDALKCSREAETRWNMVRSLFACMALCVAVTVNVYGDTENYGGYTWTFTIENGMAKIANGNDCAITRRTVYWLDVDIPTTLGGCPVTEIGSCAFKDCNLVTCVNIPSSITKIGDRAFEGCGGLLSISIPESVKVIGRQAFYKCYALKSVALSFGLEVIGAYAFSNCKNITAISIPDSVKEVAGYGFQDCTALSSVKLSKSQMSVGGFSGCTNLSAIEIPDGVSEIGGYAFSGCDNLADVNIPTSVCKIGSCAFRGCNKLGVGIVSIDGCVVLVNGDYGEEINLPKDVRLIGDEVFRGCNKIKQVHMAGCEVIGLSTFLLCSGMTNIVLGASTVGIDKWAFYGCSNLRSLIVYGNAPILMDEYALLGMPSDCVVYVRKGTVGWDVDIPGVWKGFRIEYFDDGSVDVEVDDNTIVTIPDEWFAYWEQNQEFVKKFGSNRSVAIQQETGKFDGECRALKVWQDYVAGTDPTKKDSVFRASVTMVEGKPVVSYTPELSAEEKAKRKYTTWGKARLQDAKWVEVSDSTVGDYNFFKVTVEMK